MSKNKRDLRRDAVRKNVHAFALNCSIRRALRPAIEFNNGSPGIIALIAPQPDFLSDFVVAAITELGVDDQDFRTDQCGYMRIKKDAVAKLVAAEFDKDCREMVRGLVLAESREDLTANILLAADFIFDVEPITERDFIAACKEVLKIEVSESDAAEALRLPRADLLMAARIGRPMKEVIQRVRTMSSTNRTIEGLDRSPRLEDMHGYGPAKDWGLQLRDDLREWSEGRLSWTDVDKGLLLSGPPGTGKTSYATALAKTCSVELVATSLGQWQATGHLGDTLKAMRADFKNAKNNAPSILFIDEIDSVGDRAKFPADHASYSIQVVNALLECIDGVDGREGVVVIGSTNNPDLIDPALRRAGRLDKHVTIPLPDSASRVAILNQHLGGALSIEELGSLSKGMTGLSGADLSQLARDAKRTARLKKRPVRLEDLKVNLPEMLPIVGKYRESIAYHEAGHTIVGHLLDYGEFYGTAIIDNLNPTLKTETAGGASFKMQPIGFRDRQSYLDSIAVGLAGVAAEVLKLGSFGDGASAGSNSDLETVTRVAAIIEAQAGMGNTLRYASIDGASGLEALMRSDHALRGSVDRVLQKQFERATEILQAEIALLDLVANELILKGNVGPARLHELVGEADIVKLQDRERKA